MLEVWSQDSYLFVVQTTDLPFKQTLKIKEACLLESQYRVKFEEESVYVRLFTVDKEMTFVHCIFSSRDLR